MLFNITLEADIPSFSSGRCDGPFTGPEHLPPVFVC